MKKGFLVISLLVLNSFVWAQNNLNWQGYFSYNAIKDISESTNKMFAASENALFSKNLVTNDIKTTNTIDGLSGENISSIYHSLNVNKTLVGYESGLVIVINDADGSMYRAIGIIQKQIPSNIKRINHFFENNGIAYIACDFGIVQFNLTSLEFGDTYFLGSSVSDYLKVIQTTIFNNSIYAITQNNGIKKGDLSNVNLNDFSQWQTFDSGSWNGIATINNQLVASNSNNVLYKWLGTTVTPFFSYSQSTVDFRVNQNQLIAVNPSKIIVFNDQLIPTAQIDNSALTIPNVQFTCATVINNIIYIGTREDGLFSTPINNPILFENLTPDGPSKNAVFGINASTGDLWAVYGGYSADYNPYTYDGTNLPPKFGYSKRITTGWINKPYSTVLEAKALTKITVNPNNVKQVYLSSFFSGLLKLINDVPTLLYNQTNSGLESLVVSGAPNYVDIRVNGIAFDKTGNIWVTTSLIKNALKVFKPDNSWQSISFENILDNYKIDSYSNIVIDKNNTKWVGSSQDGVIAYNENGALLKKITIGSSNGNLPAKDVRVLAIDTKNQLWIGTTSGLRVLPSVDSFISQTSLTTNAIIILEDNLAQELFYEQTITDIVVDGANRKWVGTADSGVFLVSSNGQQTIYHFTSTNSPLPSNTILDIDINPETGEVYFATPRGMISFKGTSTKASDDLSNVYIYPNPVRPEFTGTVKISGLIDKANIKITDIEGNLVFETTSEGGTIEWDTTAFGKYKVASGVYMVFIASQDGSETKVKKVMIIR